MADAPVHPNPIFEGSEKRLQLHFQPADGCGPETTATGLRAIPRQTLDDLMTLAACEIISRTSNDCFDSYVLSESSLFVYPTAWVIKTCGTTKLLNCLETLLHVAAELGLRPHHARYSRASFLYPDLQPELYQSFDAELALLRRHLGHIGNGGSAFVLGDKLHGLQYHLFVVSADAVPAAAAEVDVMAHDGGADVAGLRNRAQALCTFEVCMTDLHAEAAAQFVRGEAFASAAHTTEATGIRGLAPKAVMDDYVFEPCGYSMNGIEGEGFISIHVTPESGFSYASCELHGFPDSAVDPAAMAAAVARIFRPGRMVVSCTMDAAVPANYDWASTLAVDGYGCAGATCQELPAGGRVWFYSLVERGFARCPRTQSTPAVMRAWPSFSGSLPSAMNLDDVLFAGSRKRSAFAGDSGSSGSDVDAMEVPPAPWPSAPEDVVGVLARHSARSIASDSAEALAEYAATAAARHALDDTFCIVNLGKVVGAFQQWRHALPRAQCLFPVAACPDPAVLGLLSVLGATFDVATEADVTALCDAGVAADRMAMLATVKRPRDVRAAARHGVARYAFDTAAELTKLQRFAPASELLLTVGVGAGAVAPAHARAMAAAAAAAGSRIRGLVFVADGEAAIAAVIAAARRAFDAVAATGHAPTSLHLKLSFPESPYALSSALAASFPAPAFQQLAITVSAAALTSNAVAMAAYVHSVDGARVHVTDLPAAVGGLAAPLALRAGNRNAFEGSAVAKAILTDGPATCEVSVPALQGDDWLLFAKCGSGEVTKASAGHTFYVCSHDALAARS